MLNFSICILVKLKEQKSGGKRMEINLVGEAVKFLILGMTTVFLFLIVMVFVLEIQSKIITKYFPAKAEESVAPKVKSVKKSTQEHVHVVAAIAAKILLIKQSK